MKSASKWIAVVLLIAAPAFADRYENQPHVSTTYRGGRITIEHSFGRVEVRTARGSRVDVQGIIRSSDEELGKQIHFDVSSTSNGVVIRSVYPRFHGFGNISWSADLQVTIPENAPLTLRDKFGSVEVSGLGAPSDIANTQGSIELRDSRGDQKVENAFGSISVENIGGSLTVNNANGSVHIDHVHGNVIAGNRFASIHVDDVTGSAVVTGANGSIEVTGVDGSASIKNAFASVRVANVGGNLKVASGNGRVDVSNVRGDADVDGSFGTIEMHDVRGSAAISDANGSIIATEIGGNVAVNTSFGSVFLKGAGGSISVDNQNGAIGVSSLRPPCRDISLRTSFSSIKVEVAPNSGYDVDARTSFGSIMTDVPITTTHRSDNSLTGTIGNGGCKMTLVNNNGSITIE